MPIAPANRTRLAVVALIAVGTVQPLPTMGQQNLAPPPPRLSEADMPATRTPSANLILPGSVMAANKARAEALARQQEQNAEKNPQPAPMPAQSAISSQGTLLAQAGSGNLVQGSNAYPAQIETVAPAPEPEPRGNTRLSFTPDLGKLLATGGVSQVEGAGGGGLTPWATITGYGSRDSYGANAHYTVLKTQDYLLDSYGVAVGVADRVEVSVATQELKGQSGALDGVRIRQNIAGIKLRLSGNLVYDQESPMPQIAVGMMYKKNDGIRGLPGVTSVTQLGAARDSGIDYYVSATKLILDRSLLLNATLRLTKANQMGLLGFGGDRNDSYKPMLETSIAYLLNRNVVVGAEYRMKPNNLAIDNEKDYYDAFVAWFPNKNFSVTAAYVSLGDITVLNSTRQRGWYVSMQAGF